jgi:hypothetical protein
MLQYFSNDVGQMKMAQVQYLSIAICFLMSVLDFLIMGVILLFVGIAITVVSQKIKHPRKRLFYNLVILFIFFLLWAELAVGIF